MLLNYTASKIALYNVDTQKRLRSRSLNRGRAGDNENWLCLPVQRAARVRRE